MPRGVYTRRLRAPKAVYIPSEDVNAKVDIAPITEATKFTEQKAAPEAAFVVSDTPSCSMTERKWRGCPVWQCPKCRVDTLDPALAQNARRACRK